MKALLLQRTSVQAEIELPPESTKLKSESDFWRHFRVACHERLETLIVAYFSGTYILRFITGLPVAQPSYKLGSIFPSGTNRTLACSARAQDISVCVECVE